MSKPIHFFLISLIFLLPIHGFSQIDTIYNLGNQKNRMTYEELKEKIDYRQSRMKSDTSEWFVRWKVKKEEFKNDTLIQFGTIHLIETTVLNEAGKIESRLNRQVPDFDFKDLLGKSIRYSELEGKVLLLNFWFTRCPPCIAEMPLLNQIKEDYQNEEIAFISMAPEEKEQILKFLKRHPFNFDHIPDADDFLKKFGVGFPKNILVDKSGIIRYIGNGLVGSYLAEGDKELKEEDHVSDKELRDMIDHLLER